MSNDSAYNQLWEHITLQHPHLIYEATAVNLTEEQQGRYGLGILTERAEEYAKTEGPWLIIIRLDVPDSADEDRLAVALAHEYGHFILRIKIMPYLGILGRYLITKMNNRRAKLIGYNYDYMTRLVAVFFDELAAWLIGWGLLKKIKRLTLRHIKLGLSYWAGYLSWLKPIFIKPPPENSE